MTKEKQKPGPKPRPDSLTNADRQRRARDRIRQQLERLDEIQDTVPRLVDRMRAATSLEEVERIADELDRVLGIAARDRVKAKSK
jgi:hypothetical protein